MRRSSAPEAAVLLLAGLLLGPAAHALQLKSLEARYQDGVYRVTLEAVVHAPVARVESVLTDYAHYRGLDPRILEAEVLNVEPDGTAYLRTRIQACAGIFCRSVRRVERVRHDPGSLEATVVPERSDLRRGETRTRWSALDSGTLISYQTEFVPDFWVPGFVANRLAVKSLRDSTLALFTNLEQRAGGR